MKNLEDLYSLIAIADQLEQRQKEQLQNLQEFVQFALENVANELTENETDHMDKLVDLAKDLLHEYKDLKMLLEQTVAQI